MVRAPDGRDYFVNELAIIRVGGALAFKPVMIQRWYQQEGTIWADVSPLLLTEDKSGLVVDSRKSNKLRIPLDAFQYTIAEILDSKSQAAGYVPEGAVIAGTTISIYNMLEFSTDLCAARGTG